LSENFRSRVQDDELPLVTVAMPVFNAGKYLRTAVLSIIKQTFTNWELLIIDDGSTDDALQSIEDINDVRILILRDGMNRGLADRLNEAIDLARGQYLARMDQDDVSYPERFEHQVKVLQNDPALDMIAVHAVTISEDDIPVSLLPCVTTHEEICARPWRGFYLVHPSWMGRIDWFRKYRYTVPGPYFCEDQELLLRSYNLSRFGAIDEVLFGYRIKSKVNWQKLLKTRMTVLRIQMRHFLKTYQMHFFLLAMITFIGRILFDLWKLFRRIIFQDQSAVASVVSLKWYDVLRRIGDKPDLVNGEKQVRISY
jgi:glycosyltransferase involved in cell wall biosynthesis